MTPQLHNLLSKLSEHGYNPKLIGKEYRSHCPGHSDEHPSLDVCDGYESILLTCRSNNCRAIDIIRPLGLTIKDLQYNPTSDNKPTFPKEKKKNAFGDGAKKEKVLSLAETSKPQPTDSKEFTSKRNYKNLAEYAAFKGFPLEIFTKAKWSDFQYFIKEENRKVASIKIPVESGFTYRILDNSVSGRFRRNKGFEQCFYGLTRALSTIKSFERENKKSSLILCNGEPSTVIAQYCGLPAFALCANETADFKQELLEQLIKELEDRSLPKEIILCLDNDQAGAKGTEKRKQSLEKAGFEVIVIDFAGKEKGYDLADFCKEYKNSMNIYDTLLTFDKSKQQEVAKNLFSENQENIIYFNNVFAHNQTDTNAAIRFARVNYTKYKFCHPWKTWLYFDGQKWLIDDTGATMRAAIELVANLLVYAKSLPENTDEEKDYKDSLLKYTTELQKHSKLNSVVNLSRNLDNMYVLPSQFDNDPWILNCQNGVLNLKTKELTPHSPTQFHLKIANANYDPTAKCPTWLKFLDKIMNGKDSLVKYLQKVIGYCLTGQTMEKALFFLYGSKGDNGKSTLVETVAKLLGNYALSKFPISVLLEENFGKLSKDSDKNVAELFGVRFVAGTELAGNKKINEEMLKDLTGGIDTVSARKLYGHPFTFEPTHKLFIFGNEKPYIPQRSEAVWNRLKTIPFDVSIPKAEQDKELPYKLRSEFDGILNWAVEGCLLWQQEKSLGVPEEITDANKDYRDEMDILKHFLDDDCVITLDDPKVKIQSQILYDAYRNWIKRNGHTYTSNQQSFSKELKSHGFNKIQHHGYMCWQGIQLKSHLEAKALIDAIENENEKNKK